MGLFEQFPYTNFHELNLDWLISELKKLESSAVISVNGETGEIILYKNAYVNLPDVTENQWNIYRKTHGINRGIQFADDGTASIMDGNARHKIYSENNPPAFPVTSVNGKTGDVTLYEEQFVKLPNLTGNNITNWNLYRQINGVSYGIEFNANGQAFLINGSTRTPIVQSANPVVSVNGQTGEVNLIIPASLVDDYNTSILMVSTVSPDNKWSWKRKLSSAGEIGIGFDKTTATPEAYIEYSNVVGGTTQRLKLLTINDIPSSAGVASVNGMQGIVNLFASNLTMSASDTSTIGQQINLTRLSIANDYDSTLTYEKNDIVRYSGLIHICTQDIITPEAFNTNHWLQLNIGEIISPIQTNMDYLLPTVQNIAQNIGNFKIIPFSYSNSHVETVDPYELFMIVIGSTVSAYEGLWIGWSSGTTAFVYKIAGSDNITISISGETITITNATGRNSRGVLMQLATFTT